MNELIYNNPDGQHGVSIIIFASSNKKNLSRLLSSFFKHNGYHPLEFIIIANVAVGNLESLVKKYSTQAFFLLIEYKETDNFSKAANIAAGKAVYPNLLFLSENIIYNRDLLPVASDKLKDPFTGAVGVRLDHDPLDTSGVGLLKVKNSGITFSWSEDERAYLPLIINSNLLAEEQLAESGFFPAVSRDFLLCRKADFESVGGFHEGYEAAYEDVDFCLRLGSRLGKKSYSINNQELFYKETLGHDNNQQAHFAGRFLNDQNLFKARMGERVMGLIQKRPGLIGSDKLSSEKKGPIRILYVLPSPAESNQGYHVQGLVRSLKPLGAEAIVAVPQATPKDRAVDDKNYNLYSYAEIIEKGVSFSDGAPPDIIHAWTPREIVRKFVARLKIHYLCPIIIHLEDNEEQLVERLVSQPYQEVAGMTEQVLDYKIPEYYYHPLRGKQWLKEVQGLTMVIETLKKFNYKKLDSLNLLPPIDETIFYPRPINYELRRQLNIPDDHTVIVYAGNVHNGNRNEVLSLYEALKILNETGHPATLIRTGKNSLPITDGDNRWIREFEKPLGWVERRDMGNIMAAADLFVQPGKPGSFNDYRLPCKLPEYFALGRPVIISRIKAVENIEHLEEAYLIDDGENARAISEAVIAIRTDRGISTKLAKGAVEYYLREFADPCVGENLYKYYKKFVDLTRQPREKAVFDFAPGGSAESKKTENCTMSSDKIINYRFNAPPVDNSKWDQFGEKLEKELNSDIKVVSCFENSFLSRDIPVHKPWIGFVHAAPVRIPAWMAKTAPYNTILADHLFDSQAWKKYRKNCRGLFTFSVDQADYLSQKAGVSVKALKQPLPQLTDTFTLEKYRNNSSKKIFQVGWWLQRVHAIYLLPAEQMGFEKLWIKFNDSNLDQIIINERKHLKECNLFYDFMVDSVKVVETPGEALYASLLSENLTFAHYYDAAMISFLVECIARKVPILINPHQAVREYLGDDYPFYYYFYKDAAEKAVDLKLVQKTYKHLNRLSKQYSSGTDQLTTTIKESLNQ